MPGRFRHADHTPGTQREAPKAYIPTVPTRRPHPEAPKAYIPTVPTRIEAPPQLGTLILARPVPTRIPHPRYAERGAKNLHIPTVHLGTHLPGTHLPQARAGNNGNSRAKRIIKLRFPTPHQRFRHAHAATSCEGKERKQKTSSSFDFPCHASVSDTNATTSG